MKLCMGCMNPMEDHLVTCPHCGFNETTLRQESYYLDPGTIIGGKYIVGRVISYGGHTVSYLGLDAERNRKVTVKEYLPSDFSTRSEGEKEVTIYSGDAQDQFEQGLTSFLNEANRIQHLSEVDGIAQIYDCVAENDTGYVISEYIEGQTLQEILDSGKKFRVEEARQFISKILSGLSRVHPLDIIHCDISPETIMITNTGDIKLLDFGATRYVTTANSKSLAIILKQGYAPEEQYRSRGVRGPWTDVYALGAVMYRMITGIVPQESVERTLTDGVKEPSKLGVKIPENVENALMNALNVYQKDRTPSAEAFLQELNSSSVTRIKVKKRKNETGKFPLWAKGVVAGMICAVIAGGIVLYKIMAQDAGSVASQAVKMPDFSGKSLDEVEEYAKSLNQKHKGWKIQVKETDFIFDADQKKNKTIAEQSVPEGIDLTKKSQVKKQKGFQVDKNGNISGTIQCTIYSNKKLHYREIKGLNAFQLAKKLGTKVSNKDIFENQKKDRKAYYEIFQIKTSGETLTPDVWEDESMEAEKISVDDMKVYYYISDFLYWAPGELKNYVGSNLSKIGKFPVYKMVNETKRTKTKRKRSLSEMGLVDASYYSFQYDKGYVCKQYTLPPKELDTHKQGGKLLDVVGEKISYVGLTGEQLRKKVSWNGTKVEIQGDSSQQVVAVTVWDRDTGKKKRCFQKKDHLEIVIETRENTPEGTKAPPSARSHPENRPTPTRRF